MYIHILMNIFTFQISTSVTRIPVRMGDPALTSSTAISVDVLRALAESTAREVSKFI